MLRHGDKQGVAAIRLQHIASQGGENYQHAAEPDPAFCGPPAAMKKNLCHGDEAGAENCEPQRGMRGGEEILDIEKRQCIHGEGTDLFFPAFGKGGLLRGKRFTGPVGRVLRLREVRFFSFVHVKPPIDRPQIPEYRPAGTAARGRAP